MEEESDSSYYDEEDDASSSYYDDEDSSSGHSEEAEDERAVENKATHSGHQGVFSDEDLEAPSLRLATNAEEEVT